MGGVPLISKTRHSLAIASSTRMLLHLSGRKHARWLAVQRIYSRGSTYGQLCSYDARALGDDLISQHSATVWATGSTAPPAEFAEIRVKADYNDFAVEGRDMAIMLHVGGSVVTN